MSVLEWKSVELFETIALPAIRLHNINAEITAHCSKTTKGVNGTASTTTVLCDQNGFVHVICGDDKHQQKPISFMCHKSQQPIKLCALTTNNLLTILQEVNNKFSLCVHIYDLRNLTKKERLITSKIISADSAATYLQAAVLGGDRMFALAMGFEKGDMRLHFGKMGRDITLDFHLHNFGSSAVNGIRFQDNNQTVDSSGYVMFVSCMDGVYSRLIKDRGILEKESDFENKKDIHNHACTISQQIGSETFFVVGRDDAIYCFNRNDRGPCYAIGGEKQYISWIDHHLVVVVKTLQDSVVIVVDVVNKIVVFHKRIKNLICMFSDKKEYYIIKKMESFDENLTYNMYKLQEHNTRKKLKLLISKNMHDSALRILERIECADSENAAYVHLQYGNNLMARGSFNRAVSEFEQTIGVIKPYDIISKLLYSRHNDNLKQYLKKLLKSEHTTVEQKKLLERCNDRENLSLRIQQLWESRNDPTQSRIFDFKQLLVRDNKFLNMLNTSDQFDNMIDVFHDSDEQDILHFFQEYGRDLLLVDATIVLETVKKLVENRKIKNILPFLIIFSDHEEFCATLLADYIHHFMDHNEKVHYYLLVLYLNLWREKKISSEKIHDYLKQVPLKFEMILILCKAYLFCMETENQNASVEHRTLTDHEANIEHHIKSNPKLENLLTDGPRSLLMILEKTCSTDSVQISDIRSLFIEKFKKNLNDRQSEQKVIENLNNEIQESGSLLSQFHSNPIEFRNSCCDKCSQPLHAPAIYFLCQHSFHKDCLSFNYNALSKENEIFCFLCNENNKYTSVSDYKQFENFHKSGDAIDVVSQVFASGIVKTKDCEQLNKKRYSIEYIPDLNPFASSTPEPSQNPFDENYDSNFNCF